MADETNTGSGAAAAGGAGAIGFAITESEPKFAASLKPGEVFAQRFRIEARAGGGAFSEVYRATDLANGRQVALKLMRADRLTDAGVREDFIREGVRAGALDNSSIVRVFDVTQFGGQPYIVMQWLGDLTLRRWLNQSGAAHKPLGIPVAANIILALLDGLDEAHRNGVIHRDLKPENVILQGEPSEAGAKLRIVDFGISASVRDLNPSGPASTGTRDYMPSEQALGAAPHPTADLFALSVMFYELLIGGTPRNEVSPAASREDVPPAIDRLIVSGLSDSASRRPQSVEEYRGRVKAGLAEWAETRRLEEEAQKRQEREAAEARLKAEREAEAKKKLEDAAAEKKLKAEQAAQNRVDRNRAAKKVATGAAPAAAGAAKTTNISEAVGGVLGLVFGFAMLFAFVGVVGGVWKFVAHDFAPTRDFLCQVGFKSSCPVARFDPDIEDLAGKIMRSHTTSPLVPYSPSPSYLFPTSTPTPAPSDQ